MLIIQSGATVVLRRRRGIALEKRLGRLLAEYLGVYVTYDGDRQERDDGNA